MRKGISMDHKIGLITYELFPFAKLGGVADVVAAWAKFLGKTNDLLEFYKDLSEYIKQNYNDTDCYVKDYEQYWIYRFLSENKNVAETVGVDYDTKLAVSLPY